MKLLLSKILYLNMKEKKKLFIMVLDGMILNDKHIGQQEPSSPDMKLY